MNQSFKQGLRLTILLATASGLAHFAAKPAARLKGRLPAFTDITKLAHVEYQNTCGDEVTEYLIDVKGGGACFLDYNNDGNLDIYLPNGSSRKLRKTGPLPHDFLLQGHEGGTFTDVTAKSGLGDTEWSWGCAVGDYNNDGYADLYVTNYGPNRLYRNNGDGTFSEVAPTAGVAGPQWKVPKWSMGAAFGDIDNDGDLDLYVTNFVDFNYQPDRPPPRPGSPCKFKGIPIACAPDEYDAQQHLLYRNEGDGTFTDVSESAGIARKDPGRGFSVVFSDFDNDGDQDIYVANDVGMNFYYVNDGKGHFSDASLLSGTAVDGFGIPQGSMGLTAGDVNHDGLEDILVTNFIDQSNTLYINEGDNLFSDRTIAFGLGRIGYEYSGWGTKFFDYDNDGWLDLWITNGHTMEQLERHFPSDTFAEPSFLLRNLAGKRFEDLSEMVGLRRIPNKVGRGTAFGDFDNDGDVDVLVTNKNDKPTFWRNDGGNAGSWVVIRTEGVKSNRDGYGARLVARTAGMQQTFVVRSSDSFLSSNDARVFIGLGVESNADLEVRWPSGRVDNFSRVASRRFYLAREGDVLKPDPRVRTLAR